MLRHNAVDRAKWPALSGLVLGTVLTTHSIPSSFAFDRVVHSAIATLACSGGAVIGLSKWLPQEGRRPHNGHQYEAVSLHQIGLPHASREPSPAEHTGSLRKLRTIFVVLVVALCLRVEVLRDLTRNVQCSTWTWEPLLPFSLTAWKLWRSQRYGNRSLAEDSIAADGRQAWLRTVASPPLLSVFALLLFSVGAMLGIHATSAPRSTFICAAGMPSRWLIPLLQRLGSALDVVIVLCVGQLLTLRETRSIRNVALQFASVGYAMLFSAGSLFLIGGMYYIVQDNDRRWIVTIPHFYVWSVLKLVLIITFTTLCSLVSVLNVGVVTTAATAAFTSMVTAATINTWNNASPFPPPSTQLAFIGVLLATLGFVAYFQLESPADDKKGSSSARKIPTVIYIAIGLVLVVWITMLASHRSKVHHHPIDKLVHEARKHHASYGDQSFMSTDLSEAVSEYQRRYNRLPPPGFDHWYTFAKERNSVIIDSFDGIDRDILPFFALSPEQIRDRTWELISNPWNDAAGISIRSGKLEIAPNIMGTHRWMADGLADMIGKIAKWLPDMDLAFNLNDEPRIAVPFEDIEPMKQVGRTFGIGAGHLAIRKKPVSAFSPGRADQWLPIPDEPNPYSSLQELSWQKTFHRYGAVGCPPDSPARNDRLWDIGRLCLSCLGPQSDGAFLANWSVAADVCHQPDLADTHGFYLSPAAFKGTHQLYPIFSQSKAHGYNDILYPSCWNYLDNAKYDPSEEYPDEAFATKNDSLFWRGATSEGVSRGRGSWRGMTRQRFVHMINNVNNSAPPQPLLLADNNDSKKLKYASLPSSQLMKLLPMDAHVVEDIVRCAGPDCADQAREFAPLVPATDFQYHWKYKYLLDMDGAGFSGRFLPFLRSRSLPFKTALFREWWDDRVTPWYHFVPLDIRGHGLWATLAYFHGLDGVVGEKQVKVDGHPREAEDIATQGREWAEKALRKEDMEVYIFRLLLEWGRLTDDRRDELGFVG